MQAAGSRLRRRLGPFCKVMITNDTKKVHSTPGIFSFFPFHSSYLLFSPLFIFRISSFPNWDDQVRHSMEGKQNPPKRRNSGGGCRDIVTAEMQSLERWCERFLKRALAALQRSPSGFRRTAAFANASCHRSTTSQWCILPRRTPAFLRIYPGRESSLTLG